MRRRVLIVPVLLLAGVLLARRRRRPRAAPAPAPLDVPPQDAPAALLESGTRFVSVPWTLVEADPSVAQLRIACSGDERMRLDRVDAQETPTQVFVTVLMRRSPPADDPSTGARSHEAVVTLSGPLGTRELVHAPVDLDAAGSATGDGRSAPPLYP